jgi:hypothetical protein
MGRVLVAAGLSLVVVLAGCGSDGASKDATKSGSTSTKAASASKTTSTTAGGGAGGSGGGAGTTGTTLDPSCHFVGATSEQRNGLITQDQYLSGVNTTSDPCTDQVTFTFQPSAAPAPSYVVDYADGPFTDSAGTPVKPPGTTYLRVRFQPAWIANLNAPNAPLTYTGPRVITPTGTHVIRGLALYDASEGVVGWIIGLDGTHPIEVDAGPGKVTVTVSAGS